MRIVLVETAAKALRGSHESNHRGPTAFTTTEHLLSITGQLYMIIMKRPLNLYIH